MKGEHQEWFLPNHEQYSDSLLRSEIDGARLL